jgi:hypothetical protein
MTRRTKLNVQRHQRDQNDKGVSCLRVLVRAIRGRIHAGVRRLVTIIITGPILFSGPKFSLLSSLFLRFCCFSF